VAVLARAAVAATVGCEKRGVLAGEPLSGTGPGEK